MKKLLGRVVIEYFRLLAVVQLKKNPKAIIIGITGSAGKTSTRLAIVHILQARGRVKHSVHANSESGIPLNILGLSPKTFSPLDWTRLIVLALLKLLFNWKKFDYYVVEMGIDSAKIPKNMEYLLKIVRPQVGVVLNTGLVHAEGFDHLVKDLNPKRRIAKLRQEIANEKIKLLTSMGSRGVAIINVDQKELASLTKKISARKITIGKSSKANLRITKYRTGLNGSGFQFIYQGQKHEAHFADLFPPHYAYTFAAALAVAAGLGISPRTAIPALESYRAPAGRLRVFVGKKNTMLLDSSYNSSPDSMREALDLVKNLAPKSRKIGVIGDMRELGTSTKQAHKDLADQIIKSLDEVLLFGIYTKEHIYPVLLAKKFPAHHFETINSLNNYLLKTVPSRSLILFKGSQNKIMLERSVEFMLKNEADVKNLCRRGTYWDRIRAKTS